MINLIVFLSHYKKNDTYLLKNYFLLIYSSKFNL